MNKNSLPDNGKLFLVPRTALPPNPPAKPPHHLPNLGEYAVMLLAAIFLAVVAFASYACLYGDWEKAKDFLLIFFPPITALLGVVAATTFRS